MKPWRRPVRSGNVLLGTVRSLFSLSNPTFPATPTCMARRRSKFIIGVIAHEFVQDEKRVRLGEMGGIGADRE